MDREAAARLGDRVDVFAAVVVAAEEAGLLRVADLLRVDTAALDFVRVVVIALDLLAGFALVAGRLERAFGAGLVRSTASVAGAFAAAAAAGRRRDPVEGTAFALADARGLMAREAEGAVVERVRRLKTRAHSSSLREEGLEPWA